MENLEISATTVEEAIQNALEQLGVDRKAVKVTVLSEGKHGILGLGAEEARIRVELLAPEPGQKSDVVETAKGVLETLLGVMGITASIVPSSSLIEEKEGADTSVAFDIRGDDLGILIGRRGQTLTCLQYIVRLIVAHRLKTWVPINIDVEGYRERRTETLRALALRMAEEVRVRGVPFTLRPMPAYERRIIHITLADHPDVSTQSVGVGEERKVVILPKEEIA